MSSRNDLLNFVETGSQGSLTGIELGVASGMFSAHLVRDERVSQMFGVDLYADHHDSAEYISALQSIGLNRAYSLLRCSFEQALPLFGDESLDFVYIDGYAHTGEDGGRTIFSWSTKVRLGGVLAGHDYDLQAWPLVVQAVDEFAAAVKAEVRVLPPAKEPHGDDRYPSWVIAKQHAWPNEIKPDASIVSAAIRSERRRARRRAMRGAVRVAKSLMWK